MPAMRVGDRVEVRHGANGTGTAIEVRADKVLVSFYASGAQLWFDLTEVVKAGINPRK